MTSSLDTVSTLILNTDRVRGSDIDRNLKFPENFTEKKEKKKENGLKKEKSGRCRERRWNVGPEWCRRHGRGHRDGDQRGIIPNITVFHCVVQDTCLTRVSSVIVVSV